MEGASMAAVTPFIAVRGDTVRFGKWRGSPEVFERKKQQLAAF